MRRRRTAALGVTLAIGVACVVSLRSLLGDAEPTTYVPPPLAWSACYVDVQCAELEVPLDHDDPASSTATLSVVRQPVLDQSKRLGVLLVVPGGPGGQGVPYIRDGSIFSVALRERFDVVSWNPRGVSEGTQVDCGESLESLTSGLDPTPETESEVSAWRERSQTFADGCRKRSGDLLPHLSTVSSARDIDALRVALGEEQLSLLGISYGTAVTSVYATLFPDRVRAAVLDGAYDIGAPLGGSNVQWATANERALTTMLRRCSRDTLCPFHSEGDPFGAFDRLMEQLERAPLGTGADRLDLQRAWTAIRFSLYNEFGWDALLSALESARRGDGAELRHLATSFGTSFDAAISISCLDRRRDEFTMDDDTAAAVLAAAPRFGRWVAGWRDSVCSFWPVEPDPPPAVTAKGAGLVLVVGSTGDVATPLAASRDLATRLDRAALLTVEGNHHTSYWGDATDRECVRVVVDGYFIDLDVPGESLLCREDLLVPEVQASSD